MVAEAASLTVLQGSEYCHANDDGGQQRHDQPPLPGARPPAETYPLPSKPRFMLWHRVPLKLRYWLARPTLPTRSGPKAFPAPFHLDIRKWFGFGDWDESYETHPVVEPAGVEFRTHSE